MENSIFRALAQSALNKREQIPYQVVMSVDAPAEAS